MVLYVFKAKDHRPPSTPSNRETSKAPETTSFFRIVVALYWNMILAKW